MKSKLVLPCLRAVMGNWVYYSSLMSIKQIHEWILPAKDIREAKSLDEILQRDLKDRKKNIANYLLKSDTRFFNSIIVGVFGGVPDWAEFDLSKTRELIVDKQDYISTQDSIGLIIFNGNEEMFAIDGQHRVAGIQIAYEEELKKNPEDRILSNDQYSVIFIAHIDDELGRKRTRKLFSDINNNAKPVAEGDKIKIDEQSLNAIVTRRIYASYPHFKNGELISLTESVRLDNDDTAHFTNLLGLNNTNKVLRRLFKKIPGTDEWDERNVQSFYTIVESFYNYIIDNVTEYHEFFVEESLDLRDLRRSNSHLLFRPVGIKLLAGLYVFYKLANGLEKLTANINRISFVFPNSPFNNVLWTRGKMEAKELNQRVALDLAIYLLGDTPAEKVPSLLERYQNLTKNATANLPDIL